MYNKISLAGDLGSGKSTVSDILISKLGAEYYSTGSIVRGVAEKMNMTVVELNKYMETHPEIDTMIDDGLRELSSDPRLLIIDSRMAWHFTEGTFKVYPQDCRFRIKVEDEMGRCAYSRIYDIPEDCPRVVVK